MDDASSSMSILSLVTNAGPVVQAVMAVLLLASLISWYMIVNRYRILGRARRADRAFEEKFWSGEDLSSLYNQVRKKPNPDSASEAVFRAGFQEFVRLSKSTRGPDAIMEGAQRSMRVALQREQSRLTKHLPFLATVGSTSPYIGLFGTVWGIMNSFRALANVSQATLSVVAPGIAEALVATAMGLFAAIPAVMAYNRYAAQSESLVGDCEVFAEEFSSVLHRQAHGRDN
ncbi:protein TolQ [Alloalcanivorax profundimaris]|uniref:Tol-Pal system protein TolQ n=1 Tax=Alloalcanivorax profundimaris TaxID=2735259 RepID=A0ABS0AV05_9GAMM|nr:protein TolQ [Alloalcanivorax profundimaris]MAO61243.1 protein TolQ [Alcanivorax sp.]MCQ6263828.1 protein TolQ [Alcanivorax sp. MM125-6]UWN48669.1 Biopolymer transport protein ExbB [Alcanivorax sp. ALC70]MAY11269.1 protein TolQ [Alcanivorax sp.]MBF1802068.1 protein TolQ [Alloalcanivorax profundimaris]|tara:strand:- start:5782 stop:6471 length:690 start_codon:yes stop_codon:yes gene_type:complete